MWLISHVKDVIMRHFNKSRHSIKYIIKYHAKTGQVSDAALNLELRPSALGRPGV